MNVKTRTTSTGCACFPFSFLGAYSTSDATVAPAPMNSCFAEVQPIFWLPAPIRRASPELLLKVTFVLR